MNEFILSQGSSVLQKIVVEYPEILDVYENIVALKKDLYDRVCTTSSISVLEVITQNVFLPQLIANELVKKDKEAPSGYRALYSSIKVDEHMLGLDDRIEMVTRKSLAIGKMIKMNPEDSIAGMFCKITDPEMGRKCISEIKSVVEKYVDPSVTVEGEKHRARLNLTILGRLSP